MTAQSITSYQSLIDQIMRELATKSEIQSCAKATCSWPLAVGHSRTNHGRFPKTEQGLQLTANRQ
jgi:hypothetical protein